MKKKNKVLSIVIGLGLMALFSCEDREASCPDGMVPCNANGTNICVPSNIGC